MDNEISGNSPTELFKAHLENEPDGCRLWQSVTDTMSWELTHSAELYMKTMVEMM